MTKARKFDKSYAQELLRIAKGDLQSARILQLAKSGRTENIFFLAEQSVEKALKAVLCAMGIAVPLIYELAVILDKFPETTQVPRSEEMTDLTQFATIRRYEEGRAQFSKEEIAGVILLATESVSWAEAKVRQK